MIYIKIYLLKFLLPLLLFLLIILLDPNLIDLTTLLPSVLLLLGNWIFITFPSTSASRINTKYDYIHQ